MSEEKSGADKAEGSIAKKLFDARKVLICEEINQTMAKRVIGQLLALAEDCTCGKPQVGCEAWAEVFAQLAEVTGVNMAAYPYGLCLGDAVKPKMGSGKVDRVQQTRWVAVAAKARGAFDTAALLGSPYDSVMKLLTLPSIRRSVANTNHLY